MYTYFLPRVSGLPLFNLNTKLFFLVFQNPISHLLILDLMEESYSKTKYVKMTNVCMSVYINGIMVHTALSSTLGLLHTASMAHGLFFRCVAYSSTLLVFLRITKHMKQVQI